MNLGAHLRGPLEFRGGRLAAHQPGASLPGATYVRKSITLLLLRDRKPVR